jgi:hypothetical protein
MTNLTDARDKANKEYTAKMADINAKNALGSRKLKVEEEKNKIARENMKNDLQIAQTNAKNRTKNK